MAPLSLLRQQSSSIILTGMILVFCHYRDQNLAQFARNEHSSLNHSAFNLANALGAFLGGWVLSHNMGWLAPIWVGFVLSLGGLAILLIALAYAKYSQKNESVVS